MRKMWTFVLAVLMVAVLSGSVLAADGVSDTKDKVQLDAFASLWIASIRLPEGLNFAAGHGAEPNNPNGEILLLGGQATIPVAAEKARLIVQLGYPLFDSDFRNGFTDRPSWKPPGWGETYTYSRLDGLDVVPILKLAFGKQPKPDANGFTPSSVSYGVGVERLGGVKIQQGYDMWGGETKFRSASADGLGWILFANWNTADTNLSLEIVPIARLDFDEYGTGNFRSVNFTLSAKF